MIVRPGIVDPSSKLATRTNDDCEVGSLLTRESRELLKSNESNALSPFYNEKKVKIIAKNRLQMQKYVL